MSVESDLCASSARELAAAIRSKEASAVEVLEAHLARIAEVDGVLNAIPTVVAEQAREEAKAADAAVMAGGELGPLHGLPVAHKDLHDTAGIRTTYGSPIYSDHVPEKDCLIVERMRGAGAITVGKTNTPEFGAGSQTFNPVFGTTVNPYDTERTCGGSSGGAAVALRANMVPLADGSDMGGSLRNPASFCNVVGLRPSPFRVPNLPNASPYERLPTSGPMARTVDDVGLFLSVLAGPHPSAPASLTDDPAIYARPASPIETGIRVAFSPTLGGLPVDPDVAAVIATAVGHLESMGCIVEEAEPDLAGADDVFETMRAHIFAGGTAGHLYDTNPEVLKDTVRWNVEQARTIGAADISRANQTEAQIWERVRAFNETYEFIVAPVSQVSPFVAGLDWVRWVDGVEMETYIEWMRSCYRVTVTGSPAISVPCGFTPDGLPVGAQIIGRFREERRLLDFAAAFEAATGAGQIAPTL